MSEPACVCVSVEVPVSSVVVLSSVVVASVVVSVSVVEESVGSVRAAASQASLKFWQKLAKVLATVLVLAIARLYALKLRRRGPMLTLVVGEGVAGDGPVGALGGVVVKLRVVPQVVTASRAANPPFVSLPSRHSLRATQPTSSKEPANGKAG